jgi:hypothetical protein
MGVGQRPERWKIHEVDEGDLDFKRVPVMVKRFDGSIAKAWVPVGMPKIHQRFLDAAFFLYREDGKQPKSFVGPYGTGCVVARAATHPGEPHHYYAVSNRHVTRNATSVSAPSPVIRINTFDGGHRFIEKTPDDWIFVGGKYDLAIADITDDLNTKTDAVSCIQRMDLLPRGSGIILTWASAMIFSCLVCLQINTGERRTLQVGDLGTLA